MQRRANVLVLLRKQSVISGYMPHLYIAKLVKMYTGNKWRSY
jgi:hypothetical protein